MAEVEAETISLNIVPDHDVKEELMIFFEKHDVKMGAVINAMGLLRKAQLCVLGTNRLVDLVGPIELLNASGVIRKENAEVRVNVNIIIGKEGKIYAGKLSSGCIATEPEGVTAFLFISQEHAVLDLEKFR
ncbi:DUF296 domain-containing protein [Candidatus Bathyarchaeota archaeon]|nr:DUF296 domain-containing protein [Candidatus Bathyarchaeota archaeon]